MVLLSKSNRKLLVWIRKTYTHSKANAVFLHIVVYFCIYFMEQERRKLKNGLKIGFRFTVHFVRYILCVHISVRMVCNDQS
jgi:hypothetical protein